MRKRLKRHVYVKVPVYCAAMKPALVWVRCPCGRIHREYLGPKDLDVRQAKIEFLEKQLALAYIALGDGGKKRRRGAASVTPSPRRRPARRRFVSGTGT